MGFKEDNIFQYVRSGDIDGVIGYLGVVGGLSFEKLEKESEEIRKQSWLDDESVYEEDFASNIVGGILEPFGNYSQFIKDQSFEMSDGTSDATSSIVIPNSSAELYHINYDEYGNIPLELLPDDMGRREAADIMLKSEEKYGNSVIKSSFRENISL